jgi:hypothetical protein
METGADDPLARMFEPYHADVERVIVTTDDGDAIPLEGRVVSTSVGLVESPRRWKDGRTEQMFVPWTAIETVVVQGLDERQKKRWEAEREAARAEQVVEPVRHPLTAVAEEPGF